jgi:PAS domain S-box-containing protein
MARAQILVAAGDPGFTGGLAADLRSLGYTVAGVVSSPEEVLQKAEETQPDLVLLDVGLLKDGKKGSPAGQLRKRLPNLIYLVGEEDPQTYKQAKITHSFDYLRRGYDSRELKTIIDMALYRRKLERDIAQGEKARDRKGRESAQRKKKHEAELKTAAAEFRSEIDRHKLAGKAALQAERQRLYAVLDTLPAYVILLAPDYSMPFVNREFVKRFSAPEGRKCYNFLFGRTSPCPDCQTYKVLDTGAPHEWEWTGPDGRNYQIYNFPFQDVDGSPLILEMGVDVTFLREKEAQIRRSNRALKTLSAGNEAVVRADSEAELLRNACRAITEEGGYRLAWIGYAEDDPKKKVRPMAQAGYEEGYLETLKITWADEERGRGPTGTAIRTGQPVLARNILTDPHFAPWRREAVKRGYASSLVLPLLVEGRAIGALNIYAGEADAFDGEEVGFLADLAGDISFGIMALRGWEERRRMAAALKRSYDEMEARVQDRTRELAQANAALQEEVTERLWSEKKLKESEARYRSLVTLSPDAIAVHCEGRFVFVNPAGARLFGAQHYGELVGNPVLDLIHPDYRELARERIRRAGEAEAPTELREIKILRLDGQAVDVETSGVGITFQGQPGVQVMLRDITARKEMEKQLAHLASFPQLNPNPVLEVDAAGTITYYNPATLESLRKLEMAEEIEAFLPPDLADIRRAAQETGKSVWHRELQIKDAVFSQTIHFARRFDSVRIYFIDITDRKAAEEALRESQQDLSRAQAVAHTGSWRLDVRNNELLWSDETYRIFGISPETPLTYEAFLAAVHPEDREYVDRKWTAALGGEPYDIEHRIVVGEKVKWVRERAELEFDPQGLLRGGFGTVQDITERKKGEKALQESEARYRSLFEKNQAVMLLIDPETGEIVDANPAACSFYGYPKKELTAKKVTDIRLAPPEEVFRQMQQVKNGKASHFFFKHRLATGEVRDVEVYSSPIQVHGRELLYSIIHDNTARKEAEDTLHASRDFLEVANRHSRMAPLLQDFVAEIKAHTGCEAVAIRILQDQGQIPYEAAAGFPEEFLASESPLSIMSDQCLCINVITGETDPGSSLYTPGASCYINRFSQFLAAVPPEMQGKTRNVCHRFGYESVALIPIIFGGNILGLIHLADRREDMVSLSLMDRLERIALTLGTAINRVRAEEGLRLALEDSRQRQKEIAALLKATRAVLESGTFEEIARSIYDSCKELIGASSGYIALLTPDGRENRVLFLDTGGMNCTVDRSLPMPVRGLRAEAYRTGKTVYDNDYPGSKHAQFLPPGHVGLKNVLFAPLSVRGSNLGLLGLGNKPGGYTENDARLAAGFAELAAVALANQWAEEEQERLTREVEMERARLQAIIAGAPEAIVVVDEKGRLLLTNPAADQLYSHPGPGVEDTPSCALFQLCHADGATCAPGNQPLLRSAQAGETHRNLEMVIAWPDGRRRDLLVNTAPLRDQQGLSSGAVGLFQDITDLKEAEKERRRLIQELEEQRLLLEAVLHQMPAGLAVLSATGKLILANEQVEQIFRQPVPPDAGVKQLTEFKIFHADGRPYRLEEYPLTRALQKGETSIDEDVDFLRGDGSRGILRASAAPIRDRHGDIMAGVVTFYDITERKEALLELARKKAEFEAIFNSIGDAIIFTDAQRRVVLANPAVTAIFGYEQEELYGKSTEFLYARKADYKKMGRQQYHLGAPLERKIFQVSYRRKDKQVFIGETLGTQVRDGEGQVLGFVGIHRDITQRKEAEAKIQKLNQELGGRIREVSERTLQLEAANKELEAFSYSVSHDLRTPLRAIEGFSRMLLEDHVDRLDPEGLRLLEVIRSNTRIMGELIDDLLALSRLGRQEIRPQKIDLGGLAVSVFGVLKNQAPSRQMDLILKPLPPALGDRSLLNQVLVNLLGNAVKFTKSRDQAIIEVGGWTEGKENIYFVKDNGVGFDMRYVDKMFGVFQRLHRREDFEGTGVGLAIVQRIISRHGGRVWAAGKVDSGAVFYFALPQTGEES